MLDYFFEIFYKFQNSASQYKELRQSLHFLTTGYYPYEIMDGGQYFLIKKGNIKKINEQVLAINKKLNKVFIAKIEADEIKIIRIN
jgi:hypothetical protein